MLIYNQQKYENPFIFLGLTTFLIVFVWIMLEGILVISGRIQNALIVAFIVIIIQQYGINKLQSSYVKYKGLFNAYKEMYCNRINKKVIEGVD